MIRERLSGGVAFIAAIVVVGALASRVATPIPVAFAAPALEGTPDDQLTVAADTIAVATAKGGSGFTFTVVSRSTLYQKEGGPLIEVPDPVDPSAKPDLVSTVYVGGSLADGLVTPDGYFLQLRGGPVPEKEAPDIDAAVPTLAALVKDGTTYRNDGEGWYETDLPPGIGLDEATIALLPKLLRDASSPSATEARVVDGDVAAAIEATGRLADAPAIHAVGTLDYTELLGPMTFALDGQGRLVELRALMRNTKLETFDLLVETVITFRAPISRKSLVFAATISSRYSSLPTASTPSPQQGSASPRTPKRTPAARRMATSARATFCKRRS